MTTVLATDALGVEELDTRSLVEVEGGDWKSELAKAVLTCIMNNWSEFKAGISEGYNNPV